MYKKYVFEKKVYARLIITDTKSAIERVIWY